MVISTLLRLLVLASFAHFGLSLPVDQSSITERDALPQWLPGAGETSQQAEGTIENEQNSRNTIVPKEKRTSKPVDLAKDFPLTNAVLKMIRDNMPVPEEGLQKRQNGSSADPSGIPFLSSLSPQTQSTMKDTIRYGIALVMKTGSWALSP